MAHLKVRIGRNHEIGFVMKKFYVYKGNYKELIQKMYVLSSIARAKSLQDKNIRQEEIAQLENYFNKDNSEEVRRSVDVDVNRIFIMMENIGQLKAYSTAMYALENSIRFYRQEDPWFCEIPSKINTPWLNTNPEFFLTESEIKELPSNDLSHNTNKNIQSDILRNRMNNTQKLRLSFLNRKNETCGLYIVHDKRTNHWVIGAVANSFGPLEKRRAAVYHSDFNHSFFPKDASVRQQVKIEAGCSEIKKQLNSPITDKLFSVLFTKEGHIKTDLLQRIIALKMYKSDKNGYYKDKQERTCKIPGYYIAEHFYKVINEYQTEEKKVVALFNELLTNVQPEKHRKKLRTAFMQHLDNYVALKSDKEIKEQIIAFIVQWKAQEKDRIMKLFDKVISYIWKSALGLSVIAGLGAGILSTAFPAQALTTLKLVYALVNPITASQLAISGVTLGLVSGGLALIGALVITLALAALITEVIKVYKPSNTIIVDDEIPMNTYAMQPLKRTTSLQSDKTDDALKKAESPKKTRSNKKEQDITNENNNGSGKNIQP